MCIRDRYFRGPAPALRVSQWLADANWEQVCQRMQALHGLGQPALARRLWRWGHEALAARWLAIPRAHCPWDALWRHRDVVGY
eukprot:2704207-Alexandrium_andersonii.AAC.1